MNTRCRLTYILRFIIIHFAYSISKGSSCIYNTFCFDRPFVTSQSILYVYSTYSLLLYITCFIRIVAMKLVLNQGYSKLKKITLISQHGARGLLPPLLPKIWLINAVASPYQITIITIRQIVQ